jgi:hypothetical protein
LTEIESLYEKFTKEKRFIANLSELTLKSYRQAFDRWLKCMGKIMPTKENVNTYVICMREFGLSPVTCNISIRSFNAFLSWLAERDYPRIQIKQLRVEKKVMKTFSDT